MTKLHAKYLKLAVILVFLTALVPALANADTTSGIDTQKDGNGNPLDLIIGVGGQKVGDWSQSTLTLGTGLALSGKLGVNTGSAAPQANLDVVGDVRIGQTTDACSTTNQGALKYIPQVKAVVGYYMYCNGTSWVRLGTTATNVINNPTCGEWSCEYTNGQGGPSMQQFCVNLGYTGYTNYTAGGGGCTSCVYGGWNASTKAWRMTNSTCDSCKPVASVTCQ